MMKYENIAAACVERGLARCLCFVNNTPAAVRRYKRYAGADRARAAVSDGASVPRFDFSPVLTVYRDMLDGDGLPAFGRLSGAGWSSVSCVLEWLGMRCACEDRDAGYFTFKRVGQLPSGLIRAEKTTI